MTTVYLNEYQKLMLEVKTELHNNPGLYDKLHTYIEDLEQKKSKAQEQYIDTFSRLEQTDYQLNNLRVTHEHLGNTLDLSEKENKLLKNVVRANGQLLAVIFD